MAVARECGALIGQAAIMHATLDQEFRSAHLYLSQEVVVPRGPQSGSGKGGEGDKTKVPTARYNCPPSACHTGSSKVSVLSMDANQPRFLEPAICQHIVSGISWPSI